MIHTTIVGRRTGRLGLSSLWLLIGFGLILLLAGCSAASSGNGPPSCDVSVASGDCDEDGVLNGEDDFPEDASRSCTVTPENSAPDTTADCDNDGNANDADNCPAVANSDQTNTDRADDGGDACDTDDDNDGELDTEDVDDDNDGLIEIATAAELDNVRHNLDGHKLQDLAPSASGDNTGCPTSGGCTGYELSDRHIPDQHSQLATNRRIGQR